MILIAIGVGCLIFVAGFLAAIAGISLLRTMKGREIPNDREPKLSLRHTPAKRILVPGGEEEQVLGRSSSADIIFPEDRSVSKRHAIIIYNGAFWIHDLQSTNGTWVNGGKIHGWVRLYVGFKIRIGRTLLEVEDIN